MYDYPPTQDAPVKRIIPDDFRKAATSLRTLGWLGIVGGVLSVLLLFSLLGDSPDAMLLLAVSIGVVTVGLAFSAVYLVLAPKVAAGSATARTVALWVAGIGIGLRVLGMFDGSFALLPFLVDVLVLGLGIKVLVQLCSADVRSFLAGR
ncbi:hypothetical protein ACFP63_18165 [Oerskovia jenensis]|uniref:ATP synthase protein I n=1 Tax=Oerskovia jenensis TaxID=162169 RepID=A0ABS2LFE5_9CELL|nr:hypothetical protein [Oerskovia jenensis]MBM7478849.1 hypothetical protein [Oerskovia jenensis]